MSLISFCPMSKSSKSRKPSHHQQNTKNTDAIPNSNTTNNHNTNSSHNNNNTGGHPTDAQHATSATWFDRCRYVTTDYHSAADDELSVQAGDLVVYEFSLSNSSGNWAHVLCPEPFKRGFVPSEILSDEPRRISQCKKKMPRSNVDPIERHHPRHLHKSSHTNINGGLSLNDDNIRSLQQHSHDHRPRFGMPHSLQGSSGKQTFQKYPPDLNHLNPPAYYNLRTSVPHYERYETDCRPFHRVNYGLFMVTHRFVACQENDLGLDPGDYVIVLNKDDEDWYWVRRVYDNDEGFVPSRFICDYEQVKSILNKGNSTVTMKSSNQNDFHTYINHKPDRESLATDQQSALFHWNNE